MKRRLLIGVTLAAAITSAAIAGPIMPAPEARADQLSTLQSFYQANDASSGSVHLSTTDISYLRAVQATLGGSGVSLQSSNADDVHGYPMVGWNSTSQSFTWPVTSTVAGSYIVNVLVSDASGTIQVNDGTSTAAKTFSTPDGGWDKINFGTVNVPTGSSSITIKQTAAGSTSMKLLSLELTPSSAAASIAAAVTAGRSQATWMRNSPVGVMFQWGQWGANQDGSEPAWPTVYQNANFTSLAQRVKAEGVSYVVWSITWTQYYIAAPINSVDAVLPGRTTTHDYLQDMLTAFHNQGLHVIFYYHDGHDSNPNADWWNAFWTAPSAGYYAEKADPMNRWLNIVTEIGNRYGRQLDGWMFDDAGTYYPAPFALVNSALRAGNPDRVYSFNPNGNGPRLTDYEDYSFGEQNDGTSYPVDTTGRITSGGFAGEQDFGNVQEDCGDWGVRTGDTTPITPCRSEANLAAIVHRAAVTHSSVAIDQRMWSDLSQSTDSIANLQAAIAQGAGLDEKSSVDDSSSAITYSGSWGNSNPGGCLNSTCHNANASGSTASLAFTGSGVTWNGIVGPDQGSAQVYIDGSLDRTVNLYAAARQVGVPVYTAGVPYGAHTLKIVTNNNSWVTVDSFSVETTQPVDDSSSSVTYSSGWQNSNPGGCDFSTCHNSQTAGSTATLSFSGTGATWYSIVGSDQGSADVYVDGTLDQTVSLATSGERDVSVPVYRAVGLPAGNHTLKIVTKSSNWVSIDSISVQHSSFVDDSSTAISYTGSWQNSNPGGCLAGTCHNVQGTGAQAKLTFSGTGVSLSGITGSDQGAIDVKIDGVDYGTVSLYNSVRTVGVPVFTAYGLSGGSHTITVTATNSSWVSVDGITVSA